MQGAALIGWFLLAQIMDIVSTYYAINILYLEEMNPIANLFFQEVGMHEFMLLKISIVLGLIFIYIFSLKRISKWQLSIEKSLQIGNVWTWVVVALNLLMIFLVTPYY